MKYKRLYLVLLIVACIAATVRGRATKPQADGVDKADPPRAQRQPEEKEVAQVPKDRISIHELKRKMDAKEKIVIIDTRAGSSWVGSLVKIKGAIHITTDQLETRMNEIPKEREIITYCT